MKGTGFFVLALTIGFGGGVAIDQASADLVGFLYSAPRTAAYQSNDIYSGRLQQLKQENKSRLTITKIGSHVLRNRLLAVGCTVSYGDFIKCPEDILTRELDNFVPTRNTH